MKRNRKLIFLKKSKGIESTVCSVSLRKLSDEKFSLGYLKALDHFQFYNSGKIPPLFSS